MKEVLELIEKKKQEFGQLPFFQFLQNKNIDPRQRLAWAPYIAPFVMTFAELNQYFLRDESIDLQDKTTATKVQDLINKHTYEDDHHWIWFLEDLEKLGLNPLVRFTDVLRFLWSEKTQTARHLAYELITSCCQKDPLLKLVVIECVEAAGNCGFSVFAQVGTELQKITKEKYRYFSKSHLAVEEAHIYVSMDNVEEYLSTIKLTEDQQTRAFELVEKVFEGFTELINQMMAHCETDSVERKVAKTNSITKNSWKSVKQLALSQASQEKGNIYFIEPRRRDLGACLEVISTTRVAESLR